MINNKYKLSEVAKDLGVEMKDELTFTVVVHAATVCSTLVILWKEVAALFKGFFGFGVPELVDS